MKKVININFQGRVIPIEETAYDILKRYVESLRLFFANEEGKEEIINDIESRIGELFGETLKKGSTCITDADVNTIIDSMGRPEDFEDDEAKVHARLGGESTGQQSYGYEQRATEGRRLYRDENHKVIAGVCSGIANYFNIDPVVIRILFLVTLGVTLVPYLILWVAVPSSASTVIGSQRKRLFRDADDKIIAGVCSGLAKYFAINVWIPRLLFLIPFFSFVFNSDHWGWWNFPHILGLSFSPGSLFVYVILWLVLPEAKSAADKLEMKGEKVDLNNIKTTIQSDLEGFKDRAQVLGSEIKEKAQEFGETIGKKGRQIGSEAEAVTRRSRRGLGDIIVLLVKIFAYFIVGCIVISLVIALFSLGVVLTSFLPTKDYILRSGWQNLFAWGTLILFIWVPVVGIVTYIIRRIAKKRGNSGIIRSTFISLWLVGLFCLIGLITSLSNDFKYRNYPTEQVIPLSNPGVGKLEIKTFPFGRYYNHNWFRMEPFAFFDEDTVYVRNIRLRIVKADNDSFKVMMVKLTNGRTRQEAEQIASNINFSATQRDTTLLLDRGIAITTRDKFRNQRLIVTVAVPVGKRIYINEKEGWGEGFSFHMGNDNNYWDWENNTESGSQWWRPNVEYVMTAKGLERVDKKTDEDNNDNGDNSDETIEQYRKSKEQMEREKEQKLKELQEIDRELQNATDSGRYHYQPATPEVPPAAPVEKKTKVTAMKNTAVADVPNGIHDALMIKFAL
ncbi:PspC domain-containing protein [Segetibacter koreensis]|uniref:PspC domain-containing protein n=1 Tax=Segetibacter koreensis TaxID=398037 RepID=UPI00036B458C|nr:PspC domain-containing protein [Segetibacter koreensis]